MRSRRLDETDGLVTYALIFDTGDEVNEALLDFEVALTESLAYLQRAIDPETGLALLAG